MTNSLESSTSSNSDRSASRRSSWFRLGAIAAASALAGGLAAVWWYRKTVTKLSQADQTALNPDFGIQIGGAGDDPTDDA
jgi:hypothetical protein